MKQYWFRPKSYGYGATPTTWQGWLAVAVFVALIAGMGVLVLPVASGSDVPWTALALWLTAVAILTLGFIRFCRSRTEGDWHWR
mgnify:FL=1